jgi:phosphoglycerate dehydrogenase-like enzyme
VKEAMSGSGGAIEDEQAGGAGQERSAPAVIGVLGAGTMGAGIAQLACRAGARTLLHDPVPDALQRGSEPGTASRKKRRAGA